MMTDELSKYVSVRVDAKLYTFKTRIIRILHANNYEYWFRKKVIED